MSPAAAPVPNTPAWSARSRAHLRMLGLAWTTGSSAVHSPAGSSPLPDPRRPQKPTRGFAGRFHQQPLSCRRCRAWTQLSGEGLGLQRASGPLGIVVLGVPGLCLTPAQFWHFQAILYLEIMLISHSCSFFRALQELGHSFQITMRICSEPLR